MRDGRRLTLSPRWRASAAAGRRLEPQRRLLQTTFEPTFGVPTRSGDDDVADLLDRGDELGGELAAAGGHDQCRGGQWVLEERQEGAEGFGAETPGVTQDHHPPGREKRWRQAGAGHRVEIDVVAPEVLDGQGRIVARQRLDEPRTSAPTSTGSSPSTSHAIRSADGPDSPFGDAIRTRPPSGRPDRRHGASMMAARSRQTRQVPRTSWVRTIRQPRLTPTAVAARDASRRSPTSRSSSLPRKVLFEADSSSG